MWAPGYVGIEANIIADTASREGCFQSFADFN